MSKPAYAAGTKTPIFKTESEIKTALRKYGAENFAIGETLNRAQVAFEINDSRIIIRMPLPPKDAPEFTRTVRAVGNRGATRKEVDRNADTAANMWEQACRAKWRALLLCIKAKLEAVASGVETVEQAFCAHIVMPTGETVDEWRQRHAGELSAGKMPPLLGGPKP